MLLSAHDNSGVPKCRESEQATGEVENLTAPICLANLCVTCNELSAGAVEQRAVYSGDNLSVCSTWMATQKVFPRGFEASQGELRLQDVFMSQVTL